MLLQILINVNRNMVLQRKYMEIATFLPITAGKCSEMAVRQPLGTAKRVQKSCWVLPRILDSLWAIRKGYRKVASKCQNTYSQPEGENAELPRGYRQKHGNVHSFSLKRWILHIYTHKKSKTCLKILQTIISSSLNYFLSHHPTFSQTQTGGQSL